MIKQGENCLLRWTIGLQDTVELSDSTSSKYIDLVWLARLSIRSFQHHFPAAEFCLLYNGPDFDSFCELFDNTGPDLEQPLQIIDQRHPQVNSHKFENPYHFYPRGVWWKWVPFRLDINKHEIAIDTDIVCIGKPTTWYDWIDGTEEIIITPERYEFVKVNTCGDFHTHPILAGKKPFNCGVVGQRAGFDFGERFFEVTREVDLGMTHNSMFITEQGAINLWIRSLELDGIKHCCLDFMRNAWIRDFMYFAEKGVDIQTVHAVTWHKRIVKKFQAEFERKAVDDNYSQDEFIADLVARAAAFEGLSRHVVLRQITPGKSLDTEFLLG